MTGLLIFGLIANLLVRPIQEKHWMTETPDRPLGAGGH
jgi:hypothetical protein